MKNLVSLISEIFIRYNDDSC